MNVTSKQTSSPFGRVELQKLHFFQSIAGVCMQCKDEKVLSGYFAWFTFATKQLQITDMYQIDFDLYQNNWYQNDHELPPYM